METPDTPDKSEEIKRMVLAGDKIGAIKLYREQTKVGLAEAKSAVEQMESQLRGPACAELTPPKDDPATPTAAIAEALFAGRKIAAIKLYRDQTKAGLAEAKRAVEEMEAKLRLSAPGSFTHQSAGKGCLALISISATVGAIFWRLLA